MKAIFGVLIINLLPRLYTLLITQIGGVLSPLNFRLISDNLNGAPRLILVLLMTKVGLTEIIHFIWVTKDSNRNANGVIKWVILPNNAQKCQIPISLQIVPLLLNKKITSGLLIPQPLTI